MKLLSLAPVAAIALLAAACSGNDGEIKVDAVQTPLTDQGKDTLFTVEIVKARDGGYATDAFKVKVTPDGKAAIEVSCTLTDANANKTLDVGDKLTCIEGAENNLGIDLAGKEVKVELFATIDGDEERVGDATWTASK
jgi:hypothetical protein